MNMKKLKQALLIVSTAFITQTALADFSLNKLTAGDGLPTLTSSNKTGFGFASVRAPYLENINYFGYVSKNAKADAVIKGKNAFFLYVWVPAAADEIGVRMISPVGDLASPEKGDFVHPNFKKANKADPDQWFDTWLRVERMDIVDPASIKKGGKPLNVLDEDDDGDDTYEEERHSKYNSLLRIKTELRSPTKALVRGLYRITLTTYKKGDVAGSFVTTIGSNIPGIKVAESPEKLHKLVNQ
jgi:hypothetical protein